MADESEFEVGIRIDMDTGVAFFGIEDVNRQLRAGRRIKELRAGGAIMEESGQGDETVRLHLAGCDLHVVFAGD